MKTIPYNCCFCGRAGTVQFEEPEGVDRMSLERLLKVTPDKIACDGCAAYERTRRDVGRQILTGAANFATHSIEDRDIIKPKARLRLVRLLQKFCANYEIRFNLRPLFEPSMVDDILDRPESAGSLISQIHRMATT